LNKKTFATEPQRTQRGAKALSFSLCPLCLE
jgi:hypothetical protein